jgi:hypothetical protein
MSFQTLLVFLLVLACPVGMMFMMRGGHLMMKRGARRWRPSLVPDAADGRESA